MIATLALISLALTCSAILVLVWATAVWTFTDSKKAIQVMRWCGVVIATSFFVAVVLAGITVAVEESV